MPRKKFRDLIAPMMADPEYRARVEAYKHAARMALALAQLRERRGQTQQSVADTLAMSQANVWRIEHENDVYLSTLAGYVAALGGRLEINAVFDDETIPLVSQNESAETVAG